MYQTSCVPCYEFGKRGYDSDPGVDHYIVVKVILSYLRGLRKYFSVMEVIKSSSYRVALMQAFTPIQMTLSLNLDTY